jgi:hypothetical protein
MTVGPVEYIILAFPDNKFSGEIACARHVASQNEPLLCFRHGRTLADIHGRHCRRRPDWPRTAAVANTLVARSVALTQRHGRCNEPQPSHHRAARRTRFTSTTTTPSRLPANALVAR